MNEILFRGRKIDGTWVYGFYVNSEFYGSELDCIIEPNSNEKSKAFLIDPKTVGRCTGLTDKNGTRIFEGDILQCRNNPKDLIKAVFGKFKVIDVDTESAVDEVIGWHYEVVPTDALSKIEPFCLPMPLTDYYIDRCSMKVIGNIHDNPELLRGEN